MNWRWRARNFVSVLLLSRIVTSEGWVKHEREPVDRYGIVPYDHRMAKGEKNDKKDKKDKSGKEYKKDSKDKKSKFSKSWKSYYYYDRHYTQPPTREGFPDENIVGDFEDFYGDFFQGHFSLSMSMELTQPATTTTNMLTLKHMDSNENPVLEPIESRDNPANPSLKSLAIPTNHQMEYSGGMISSSQEDVSISLAPYSIVFSFMDSVIPTRREDYSELVTITQLVFKDFMIRSYESNTLPDLIDFQVEFVRTGISEFDEIFIVFRSTAIFDSDSDSYTTPAASRIQDIFGSELDQEEELWMEYITLLQEMNPDNAFSSTVNIFYTKGFPDEAEHIDSTSSRMDSMVYTAAAGVTILSIVAFIVQRRRDRREFEGPYFNEKSKSVKSCASTVAESMTYLSSSIYDDDDEVYIDEKDEETEEGNVERLTHNDLQSINLNRISSNPTTENESIGNCTTLNSDAENMSWPQDSYQNAVVNSSLSRIDFKQDESLHESLQSNDKRLDELQERRSRERNSRKYNSSKTMHQKGSNRPNDDEGVSQEKLREDLAIIEAEEAARNADELRLKEERRLAEQRESSEKLLRFQEYARRAEELKHEKSKSNPEAFIDKKDATSSSLKGRRPKKKENKRRLPSRVEKLIEGAGMKIELEQEINNRPTKTTTNGEEEVDGNLQLIEEAASVHETIRAREDGKNDDYEIAKDKALAADILIFKKLRIDKQKKELTEIEPN